MKGFDPNFEQRTNECDHSDRNFLGDEGPTDHWKKNKSIDQWIPVVYFGIARQEASGNYIFLECLYSLPLSSFGLKNVEITE